MIKKKKNYREGENVSLMSKPKSAYSIPGKVGKMDTHVIVVWVDNEAGVLARVVGLFSGRGYNIESLAVAEIDYKKKSFENNHSYNGYTSSDRTD